MSAAGVLVLTELEPAAAMVATASGFHPVRLRADLVAAAADLDRWLTAGRVEAAALAVREVRAYVRALAAGGAR